MLRMKKILLGSGHTEALAKIKGRCVNFSIIHLNAKLRISFLGVAQKVWRGELGDSLGKREV